MKQEKGITLVSLMITVLILAIIIGVGIHTASPLIGKANAEDLKTELMAIQAKWKIEREKVNFDGDTSLEEDIIQLEGEEKGKLKEEYRYAGEVQEWMDTEVKAYYQLPDKALENLGIKLKKNEGYLVNYENDEIIYLNGFEAEDGKTYYTLSDIKGL